MTSVFDRNPTLARPRGRAAWAETFEPVLAELREGLQERQPEQIAVASGAVWDAGAGEFRLHCLDEAFRIDWPALIAYPVKGTGPCAAGLQGLFLYYFILADGTPPAGHWLGFRELPDGWLYHQAFQGYTGHVLAQALDNDIDAFRRAATDIGGQPESMGDAGYSFDVLPRVRLAVVYWLGDDEFPPHAQVLFDAAAGHCLPIDGQAFLGSRLIHRLLRETP